MRSWEVVRWWVGGAWGGVMECCGGRWWLPGTPLSASSALGVADCDARSAILSCPCTSHTRWMYSTNLSTLICGMPLFRYTWMFALLIPWKSPIVSKPSRCRSRSSLLRCFVELMPASVRNWPSSSESATSCHAYLVVEVNISSSGSGTQAYLRRVDGASTGR